MRFSQILKRPQTFDNMNLCWIFFLFTCRFWCFCINIHWWFIYEFIQV